MKEQIIQIFGNYFKYMSYNNLNPLDYGFWIYNYKLNCICLSDSIKLLFDNAMKEFEKQTAILTKSLVQLLSYGIVCLFPYVIDRFTFILERADDVKNVTFFNMFLDEIIKSPHFLVLLCENQDDKVVLSEKYVEIFNKLFDSYYKSVIQMEFVGKEKVSQTMKIRYSKFLLKLQQVILSYCNELDDINKEEEILSNYFTIILKKLRDVRIYDIINKNMNENKKNYHFYIPLVVELCDYLCAYIKSDYCLFSNNLRGVIKELRDFILLYDEEVNKDEKNIVYIY